jgi:hypothetical protein
MSFVTDGWCENDDDESKDAKLGAVVVMMMSNSNRGNVGRVVGWRCGDFLLDDDDGNETTGACNLPRQPTCPIVISLVESKSKEYPIVILRILRYCLG